MKFLPGVTYVTCTRCKGEGRVQVAMAELPGTRMYNQTATRYVLSMMLVIPAMLGVPVLAGISPWEILRHSMLAAITLLAISVAGGFAIPWILQRLTTERCHACRGGGWVPGAIP